MPVLVVYALLALAPSAALLAATHLLVRWCHSYPAPRPRAARTSLERMVADLRRLEADYRRIAGSDLPGRVARMRTVTLAYDDRLRDCCCALGLPQPGDPLGPDSLLSPVDRLHTEAALAQQGVTW